MLFFGDAFCFGGEIEVGDDDDSTVFEIVALPDANISAIDFELTDNAGLTDFTLSDALADWTVQANTSTPIRSS